MALQASRQGDALTMSDSHRIKTDLRKSLRQRRNALSAPQQLTAANTLVDSVLKLPTWTGAKHIAMYLANDGEIDTEPLNTIARSLGKQLYLPKITDSDTLEFARWETGAQLRENRYNIPEPPSTAQQCPVSQLDIVFLPLVGWDRFGCRLGMGGGFYDRALANIVGPLLVGLAHECQQAENIPQESWDLVVEFIATDAALYRRREKPRRP